MSKELTNKTKQREKTHRVVVAIDLPADSVGHAEEVVKNSITSSFHDTEIISSSVL